jgi:hypothetical protein
VVGEAYFVQTPGRGFFAVIAERPFGVGRVVGVDVVVDHDFNDQCQMKNVKSMSNLK